MSKIYKWVKKYLNCNAFLWVYKSLVSENWKSEQNVLCESDWKWKIEKLKNLNILEFFIFSKISGSIFDGDIFIEDFINPEKFNPVTKTW